MTAELGRRLAFTVGALLVFRLGTFIPLPGLNADVLAQLFRAPVGGGLGVFGLFSGGAVHRMAIFALGIMPFLTAAILLQFVSIAVPALRALGRQGARGRRRMNDLTICLTVVFAAFQGFGIAEGLEGVSGLVVNPGWLFRLTTVVTLAGGSLFLVWLSAQVTARGIGNGIAVILSVGLLAELPTAIAAMLELGRQGVISTNLVLGLAVLAIVLIGLIVVMELGQRRLPVDYAPRQVGPRTVEGRSMLTMKINGAGIMPVIFASWLLVIATTASNMMGGQVGTWWTSLTGQGRPAFLVLYAVAIVLCVFLYSAFLLDPEQAANDLKDRGGVIGGVDPGEATAAYLDNVLTRTTFLGAVYLAVVCLVPEILIAYSQVPFYFGGTSLLLVVCTILDVDAQLKGSAAT